MRLRDMRKALLACALVFCPLAARAQSTFSLTSPQATTSTTAGTTTTVPQIFIGKAACASEQLSFNWDLTALGGLAAGQLVNIVKVHNSGECSGTSVTGTGESLVPAPTQGTTGTETVSAESMILDLDAGLPGGCDNETTTSSAPWVTFFCVQVETQATLDVAATSIFEDIQINYATAPPTPPADVQVAAGDQHLKIFWSLGNSGETIATYQVHVLELDAGLDVDAGTTITAPQQNADISKTDDGADLQDDVTYNIAILATDSYGNVSEASETVTGTPIHILDFYGLYRSDNGRATGGGGCSSAGAATWIAMLALLTALLARRRKKTRNGALLIGFFTLLAPKAQAQGYERPEKFLLVGLKVDRYDPKVDSEQGLTGDPYHQVFGPRAPLRWQLEVDWEAWHPYGTVMLGVTAGYWQNFGKGIIASSVAAGAPVQSQDTALLDVIPIGLIATYRFDQLTELWPRFPVIPYAQIGLMRALWASFNGVGNVSKDSTGRGGSGSGWTWGYTTALGVAFSLDALDPELSREAFEATHIQRTSLFAEYGWTRLDGFHSDRALILSDRAWRFGVAMEF
jgi:uncharacterized protein (TIGR03382 family)